MNAQEEVIVEEVNEVVEPVETVVADAEAETAGEVTEAVDEEVVVTIGEEVVEEEQDARAAPEWVRELRKNHRELQKKNRELEEKLKATAEPQKSEPSKKPTLEDCDYDAEAYDQKLEAWFKQKQQAELAERKKQEAEQAAQAAWQAKLDAYSKARADLKVQDYDDIEAQAQELFSVTQQGIILQGADNPALLVYALGKNPKKAKELSSEKDPVKFAFAIAKLETQLKVTKRTAPPPEKVVSGTAPKSGGIDSTLDRLRAEAERTGDYSKVVQHKKQKKG